ncbi:hypothetical protein ZIOFF_041375 [Zingiber officinale]|uniref:UvrD-like helicase ATP-binding domain-containing protein n=1 Tax=Zingiber officinale TaxID=94328 RepID=A0A8J5GBE4_ZINOF|nr:hypothetical protein ZIOFF_041375 [Zingiber officinale]
MIPEKTILDDDLDEAFLHEVDAICEKRSTVKKERLGEEAVENKGCVVGGYKDLGSCRLRGLLEGIDPSNILAMTFTIAAASEMRDQIGIVARKAVAKEIEISTFNSFCFQLAGNMQKSVESNPCCAPLWCKNFFANEDKANSSFPILFLFCLGSSSTCMQMHLPIEIAAPFSLSLSIVQFAFQANDNEIPLLHEYNDVHQGATTLEERRLLYVVAMTRARKKYIVYVIMDSSWQRKYSLLEMRNRFDRIPMAQYGESIRRSVFVSNLHQKAKASGRTAEDCGINGDETGALILENYDKILSSCNALDFHDFISSSVKLLADFPEVYNECWSTWKAIVIDEFQDTSSLQYGLLRILASHNRVKIIGDEDQVCLFSSDICISSCFLLFLFLTASSPYSVLMVRLKKNYRSTKCIVEVSIKEWRNEDAQCAFVIDKILEMTSHDSMLTSPLAMLRFFTGDKSLEKHPKHVCKTGEYLLILMGLPFIGKRVAFCFRAEFLLAP